MRHCRVDFARGLGNAGTPWRTECRSSLILARLAPGWRLPPLRGQQNYFVYFAVNSPDPLNYLEKFVENSLDPLNYLENIVENPLHPSLHRLPLAAQPFIDGEDCRMVHGLVAGAFQFATAPGSLGCAHEAQGCALWVEDLVEIEIPVFQDVPGIGPDAVVLFPRFLLDVRFAAERHDPVIARDGWGREPIAASAPGSASFAVASRRWYAVSLASCTACRRRMPWKRGGAPGRSRVSQRSSVSASRSARVPSHPRSRIISPRLTTSSTPISHRNSASRGKAAMDSRTRTNESMSHLHHRFNREPDGVVPPSNAAACITVFAMVHHAILWVVLP